ncbi:flagellar basal body L-ring protein FlgH [Chitinimonas taiwanensis]|uniref:Flagellar L-ring protein n=1 Tax=Chitinimonas taiwanensis DSM 18899 TaxID=1121279 RepID=A0A1K2HM78_9NEIS|nr:flagellar basal body L-ring protein FlgH [Chitinimonas taiwanensis]SFZ77928.1 flagellar L-ring protein precursor FlgH [Chitinimonas taiwanensis DSM 18899]
MIRRILVCSSALWLAACASSVPPTIISQPTSVRPVAVPQVLAANGSIFQTGNARMMFEDPSARYAGDNITIRIEERVNASSSSDNQAERTSENTVEIGANSNFFDKLLRGLSLGTSSTVSSDGSGSASTRNSFTGDLTAQVVEVLPNGNLVVSGEKQVNIRGEVSYLRVSGIVNPANITAGNVVSSTKLAEARIEEVGSGTIASATNAGWLQRFFFSFLPF